MAEPGPTPILAALLVPQATILLEWLNGVERNALKPCPVECEVPFPPRLEAARRARAAASGADALLHSRATPTFLGVSRECWDRTNEGPLERGRFSSAPSGTRVGRPKYSLRSPRQPRRRRDAGQSRPPEFVSRPGPPGAELLDSSRRLGRPWTRGRPSSPLLRDAATAYLGFRATAARASASTRTGSAAGRRGTAARRRPWRLAREGRG